MRRFSTAVTITDPLVKYQTLVRAGVYAPDPGQHRLARHLRHVYERVKDYSPQAEYRQRLSQVAHLTKRTGAVPDEDDGDKAAGDILALRNHSIWRNPLFKHLIPSLGGSGERDSVALTRILSSHETAMEMDSPKGLFLSGEVGTGKSMLLDLLADGLPTERKRRWHFNTFMLYIFAQLDKHRNSGSGTGTGGAEVEFSLVWMAKKLVDESPILFLDEFQLPDRAASKILSHLFIAFFQLGGVLVASSNRVPEELQKASGIDYAPGPARGLMSKLFPRHHRGELYGQSSDFANFLDVLKARCDFWQMEGSTDWRRCKVEVGKDANGRRTATPAPPSAYERDDGILAGNESDARPESESDGSHKMPRNYHLCQPDEEAAFDQAIIEAAGHTAAGPVPWQPSTLVVYGRQISIPRHSNGTVLWHFSQLVDSFGPADYITLASSFHTFIIDDVPVLTVLQKNEARRFITFLDALYEARCKLVVRAAQPPDDLFFPTSSSKAASPSLSPGGRDKDDGNDATYSETVAEVYQDQTSPFRPNVSHYDAPAKYDPDQDSDFGLQQTGNNHKALDFANTGAFTGEDEKFAYKRAVSRLWELCSASWHARTGDGWWRPLPLEARHWEGGSVSRPMACASSARSPSDASRETMGPSVETDVAGLARLRVEHLRGQ
ncbi:mitochondrial ATPase (Afg1) [Moelleriella libera RCEF 2490]|uniref:Mitochondrial ATPase (Afg1) n=1 Tax=Moelleriella libera RCEF 2490 TaxID=1081109 RepID=A0A166VLK2_9HYPO|nr:mitochondrial ATPase (Afg1) [Moelleriella libera RCEF 2490]